MPASRRSRSARFFLACLAAVFLFQALRADSAAAPARKPDVLFLVTDDQGYGDLSCLGSQDIPTPNIDALAKRGLLLTAFYGAPVCSPARASLLTGRYAGEVGARGNIGSLPTSRGIYRDVPTAAELFRTADYFTFTTGKWHLGGAPGYRPWDRGFDRSFGYLSGCIDLYNHVFRWGGPKTFHDLWENGQEVWHHGEFLTDLITAKTLEILGEASAQKKPFFGYIAFNAPHYPINAPSRYMDRFKNLAPERRWMAAMIAATDDGVGKIVDLLRSKGRLDNTVIIFVSDNGPSRESRNFDEESNRVYHGGTTGGLRGEKFSLFEGGIRVPGLISWPAGLKGGGRIEETVTAIDLVPTVLAACGVAVPETRFDGMNLLPFLRGDAPAPKRLIFWEFNAQTAVRDGAWKLILNGQSLGTKPDPVFLVDLRADPVEETNVAGDHPEIVARLQAAAQDWRQKLDATVAARKAAEQKP